MEWRDARGRQIDRIQVISLTATLVALLLPSIDSSCHLRHCSSPQASCTDRSHGFRPVTSMRKLTTFLLIFALNTVASAQDEVSRVDRESFYSACSKMFPKYIFRGDSKETFDSIFDYWESTEYMDKR